MTTFASKLAKRIGDHKVTDDPEILEAMSHDESHCPARLPDLVIRASTPEDIRTTLELASIHGIPITPRGGGTGKSGGAIPAEGGAVLDITRLNSLIELDRENLVAIVQPGIVTGVFQTAVEDEGLFYPPDPNSLDSCTMGGNAAHNAGGPRAFKYGVTREYILGTKTVLMGGEELKTGKKTVKGVAGYDLTSLLVGSEGTLGVFVELTVRLTRKPPHISTLLIEMPDEISAGKAVAAIVSAGLVPRVLEFMDAVLVDTLRQTGAPGVREGVGSLLLAEFDGPNQQIVEADSIRLADLCESNGANEVIMARHSGEAKKLWAARRTLSDSLKKRASHKVSEDIVVPRSNAPLLLEGLKKISEKHNVLVPSYGHAGDGNYHVNLLWDDTEYDPRPALDSLVGLTLSLNGTITGEHGVGLAKKEYLPREVSKTALETMKNLKRVLDPHSLMNPGKIF